MVQYGLTLDNATHKNRLIRFRAIMTGRKEVLCINITVACYGDVIR